MGSHRREPRQQPGGGRLTRPSLGRLWSCVRSFRLMPELQVEFFVIRYCWIFSNYNLLFIDGILTQYFEGEDGVSRGILFGDLFNIYNSISNKVNILIKLTQIKGNLKCKRISLVITVHLCLSGWLQLFKTDKMNDPLSGGGGMGWETAYTVVPSKQSCFWLVGWAMKIWRWKKNVDIIVNGGWPSSEGEKVQVGTVWGGNSFPGQRQQDTCFSHQVTTT